MVEGVGPLGSVDGKHQRSVAMTAVALRALVRRLSLSGVHKGRLLPRIGRGPVGAPSSETEQCEGASVRRLSRGMSRTEEVASSVAHKLPWKH